MTAQNIHPKEVFKEPPMTAYRRQTNIRDILVKAKVPLHQQESCQKNKGYEQMWKQLYCLSLCQYDKRSKSESHRNMALKQALYMWNTKLRILARVHKMWGKIYWRHRKNDEGTTLWPHGLHNNQVIGVTTGDHINLFKKIMNHTFWCVYQYKWLS